MKQAKFLILLAILIPFSLVNSSYSEEEIVFNDINPVVIDLQSCKADKETNILLNEKVDILNQDILIHEEIEQNLSEYSDKTELETKLCREYVKEQDTVINDYLKSSEVTKLDLEKCKTPQSWWEKIKTNIVILETGIFIGILFKTAILTF